MMPNARDPSFTMVDCGLETNFRSLNESQGSMLKLL